MDSKITTSDNRILWDDHPIRFFKKVVHGDVYLKNNEIDIDQTDCGWSFKITVDTPCILGLMIPITSYEIIIVDMPVVLHKSKRFYCPRTRNLERLMKLKRFDVNYISIPVVHFTKDDKACSWSYEGECIISTFVAKSQWHLNLEVWSHGESTFFMDESSNFLVNLQRHPVPRGEVLINKTTSIRTMQRALLFGHKPRKNPNHTHDTIRMARGLQLELKKHKIDSIIIGSLARRLNAIPVDVEDIDLMIRDIDSMTEAINVLGSLADPLQKDSFLYRDHIIDLCYDNYNNLPSKNYTITRHGLTYLSMEGLLWLYMINLFATELDEHSDDYRDHVVNALVSIQRNCSTGEFDILPYAKSIDDFSSVCYDWCETLSGAVQEYRDIRINKPLSIRCFRDRKKHFYPIINFGSICDAEIVIDVIPETATWQTPTEQTANVSFTPHDTFSVVNIPNVPALGLLTCTIA